jgi:hypothetical protein
MLGVAAAGHAEIGFVLHNPQSAIEKLALFPRSPAHV